MMKFLSLIGRLAGFVIAWLALPGLTPAQITAPVPTDPRLEVTLFATEPDIVTPVGIAVDAQHRVFVLESHTHMPRPDYAGPKDDRVKLFVDTTGDGRPDRISVFAAGLHHALHLRFSPEDELYVVHRNGVLVLHDRDGDGVSEARSSVLEMETAQTYPHNGLGGIAFSPDGWLYVGLGENYSSDYVLKGTDGTEFRGGNGEGMIFRCRPDGSQLQAVARGFWNPFGLETDRAGNLFCVDNDDGALPPDRLLHIVRHGDYGYQRRFGGQHPFVAWDGELPGTLPMMAPTGTAPSDVLDADKAALPPGYQGALLVTAWGDHTIELYRPEPAGASFRARREILVRGKEPAVGHITGESFCPVALAVAPDGTIYISDWSDRSAYPVHGKGRVWRLSAKRGVAVVKPNSTPPRPTSPETKRMERLLSTDEPAHYEELRAALTEDDPFIRSAAFNALARPAYHERVLNDLNHSNPAVRAGLAPALQRAQLAAPAPVLKRLLADENEAARFVALRWIAEENLTALADHLPTVLVAGPVSVRLFNAYLAAVGWLDGMDRETAQARRAKEIERILYQEDPPPPLLAAVLPMTPDLHSDRTVSRLIELAKAAELPVRLEAIRTMSDSTNATIIPLLMKLAGDRSEPADLRAEAIVVLGRWAQDKLTGLLPLLDDPAPAVRVETARALRRALDLPGVTEALAGKQRELVRRGDDPVLLAQLELATALVNGNSGGAKPATQRPGSHEEWQEALLPGTGDPASGRRLFFNPLTACSQCHVVQGRGQRVGPDLTQVGRARDRPKLIEDILAPSREIAPQYEHHIVETTGGVVHSGTVMHTGLDGTLQMHTVGSGFQRIPAREILSHQIVSISLMPEGLEQVLTVQDFIDLLAFLESLK